MFSRLSIRARITIGSVLAAALLLACALFVVRGQVALILSQADETLATNDLTSFVSDITANPDERVDDPGTGVLVLVTSPRGGAEVNTLPKDVFAAVRARDKPEHSFTLVDDDDRSFIVVSRVVDTPVGEWKLWAARSTSSSSLALEGLDSVLVVAGLVLLLGIGVASWILTSLALRPVTAMRRRAEQLGDVTDGSLPVGAAQDELAALATTLNAFISNVRTTTEREKQMVSDAAHELRTPLAALKIQLELAHNDFGNADALSRRVTSAEASVDRLASLAANLLELSRLEGNEPAGPALARELVDEFTGSVDRARLLALAKSAEVEFEVSVGDESAPFRMDAHAWGRLTDNLFANAIAAVAEGGHVIARLTQSETSLALSVHDDGSGMPDEFVPHAFERFSRPDESRAGSTGGSGLGLAVVRALAVSAGGSASVHNRHPGLEVIVTIPNM
ncbi:MAG: sensor histidine kinase [Microbacteriaceae bacterium]